MRPTERRSRARRPGGGGVCTLLVRRVGARRVPLLHHVLRVADTGAADRHGPRSVVGKPAVAGLAESATDEHEDGRAAAGAHSPGSAGRWLVVGRLLMGRTSFRSGPRPVASPRREPSYVETGPT